MVRKPNVHSEAVTHQHYRHVFSQPQVKNKQEYADCLKLGSLQVNNILYMRDYSSFELVGTDKHHISVMNKG